MCKFCPVFLIIKINVLDMNRESYVNMYITPSYNQIQKVGNILTTVLVIFKLLTRFIYG